MNPFAYGRASDPASAVRTVAARPAARFVAGGTSLLDLMKEGVEHPDALVDVNPLPLAQIELLPHGMRIGAMVRNSDLALHPEIQRRYPMLSEALLSGASPQLRNLATVGGNLLQRTRCPYFRDVASGACNKRAPGSGCAAIEGMNRTLAILGTSSHCIANHPSDMAVAMIALGATVHTLGPNGTRVIPLETFYVLPGDHPEREHVLGQGELIVAVELPELPFAHRSSYLKVRDRASYEFALVSAAAALALENGTVRQARLAFGGIGAIPWRAHAAEASLVGQPATSEAFRRAAEAELVHARPHAQNHFKVELAKRTLVRVLEDLCAQGGTV